MMTDEFVAEINRAVPRAKPPCPKCRGTGHYYDPPEPEQRRQVAAGTREFTVGRTCECIRAEG